MADGLRLLDEVLNAYQSADGEQREMLDEQARDVLSRKKWVPTPGPQTEAYFNKADILLYGGEGGGGKTDLLCGLAIEEHHTALIMRRLNKEVEGLVDRLAEIIDDERRVRRGTEPRIKLPNGGFINLAGAQNIGDEKGWMGRGRDFLGLDEATHFAESQVRGLLGWMRTSRPGQRTRAVFATNPPIDATGEWIIPFFGPWLDITHPNPAKPGELRWFITAKVDGRMKDIEVEVEFDERGKVLPVQRDGEELYPKSRSFIPSTLGDNPFLNEEYQASLDALPEPLRSAVREGNFAAARADADWQVIPAAWILAAQQRWAPIPPDDVPMCAIALDPSRGGADDSSLAMRYDGWYAPMIRKPGSDVTSGEIAAGMIITHRRNDADICIDMGGGWGTSPYDILTANGIHVHAFDGSAGSTMRTKDGKLGMFNERAAAYWSFREALDPEQDGGSPIALPPDPRLVGDLAAPTFKIENKRIKIEKKEAIKTRIGRSPDDGDAVVMAWRTGPRWVTHETVWRPITDRIRRSGSQNGAALVGRTAQKRRRR